MVPPLDGKMIVAGLSGGIACYKAADLVRTLTRLGAKVRVIMTAGARHFITPLTLQTLTGQPVATDTFDLTQESQIGHIQLADRADLIVIAPATANVIGKIAAGIGDDLLTTVLLATRAPIIIAPAMNVNMYENPIVQDNLKRLRARGCRVVEPGEGALACGWEGKGRLADASVLVAEIQRAVAVQDLCGERVLVTAGPTREPIDPVRFISNRSTGKMGFAVAAAAWRRGADVRLVSGPTSLPTPSGIHRLDVITADAMRQVVSAEFESASVLFMAAAVADYRPARTARQKLKKGSGRLVLELDRTVDILVELAARKGPRLLVGFAAETERVIANAQRKLAEKGLDLVVANDVSGAQSGFAADTNAITLIDRTGHRESLPLMSKDAAADRILDRVVVLKQQRSTTVCASGRVQSA
ncbi:MAG: bifunctional phosphopantothenoylcysteine decarboxylase/phosphopantothenate--cysteine ligase CoaBC [Candidatus Binatia bacterium]